MLARRVSPVCAGIAFLAVLQGVSAEAVKFPETPRSAGPAPAPAGAPGPAASPAAAPAEARLLADSSGAFGLGPSSLNVASSPPLGPGPSPGLGLSFIQGLAQGAQAQAQARRRPDCPLCDPSVYSYCGDRLLHDACCCLRDSQPLPPQCNLADCSFLHAKSCYEHELITRCCCDRRIF